MFLKNPFKKKYKDLELYPEDIFYDSLNRSNLNNNTMEGKFEQLIDKRVYILLFIIFIIIFLSFIYKLFNLQVVQGQNWRSRSESNYMTEYPLFAMRGVIKDRNGVLLAWNNDKKESIDFENLNASSTITKSTLKDFVNILKTDTDIIKRQYIDTSEGFANILGYYSYPKKDSKGVYWKETGHGVGGVEGFYDKTLNGVNGKIILSHDVSGNILKNGYQVNKGIQGQDITLSLDYNIQKAFFKTLSNNVDVLEFRGGAGMMVNLSSGEILAMSTYPSFDNNIWTNRQDYKNATEIINTDLQNKKSPLIERNSQTSFVPGSIVKPFVGYAVLSEGVVDKFQNIFSSGKIVIKNIYGGADTIFRDWMLNGHGYVDLKKAIAVSSDEYFYQTVGGYEKQKGIGIDKLNQYMNQFYFATTTGIDFPEEVAGQIPGRELKKKLTGVDWKLGNTYHASIGQDDWKVTSLEVLRSLSFIALNGKSNQLHLVKSLGNDKLDQDYKNELKSKEINITLKQNHIDAVKEGMSLATDKIGTAHWYNVLPFKVYGKTGTAQMGVRNEFVNSWTIGYWQSKTGQYYAFLLLLDKGPANNKVGASQIMLSVLQTIVRDNVIDGNYDIK